MNLLTTQELADAAGINYELCKYRLRTMGAEPTKKAGRSNLYDESFVDLVSGKALQSMRRVYEPKATLYTVVIARSHRQGRNWLRDRQLHPSMGNVHVISTIEEVQRLQGFLPENVDVIRLWGADNKLVQQVCITFAVKIPEEVL